MALPAAAGRHYTFEDEQRVGVFGSRPGSIKRVGCRKIEPIESFAVHYGQRQQLGEPHDFRHRFRISSRRADIDTWIARFDKPLSRTPRICGIGPGRPHDTHLVPCGKISLAGKTEHGAFTRHGKVDRPLRFAHRHLQQATDNKTGIVLMLQAVIDLGVLPNNPALVPRLLYPLHGDIARSRHRTGIGAGPGAGGNQDRVIAPPCGMNCSAIIQSADIDVNGGRRRLISHHGAAQRCIESHAFMRHRDQLRSWPSLFLGSGHALLPKAISEPETKNRCSTPPSFIAWTNASDHSSAPYSCQRRSREIVSAITILLLSFYQPAEKAS